MNIYTQQSSFLSLSPFLRNGIQKVRKILI
nr:MAG TPA: hypothetical protein [Caudoviricetes sp.]